MEIPEANFSRYKGKRHMALAALQEIQESAGYISDESVHQLASALDLPEGELRGVISFYTELRATPPGRHRLRICRGDSCAALGAQAIEEAVEAHLDSPSAEVARDRVFTHEPVYCLGNCALSPSVAIDDDVYGRATPESVVRQLRELAGA